MATTIKNLDKGTITTTAATPGPSSGKAWLIKSVILTNRDSVSRTMDVKAVGKWIAPPAMALAASSTVILDTEITLQNPDGLSLAVLTTASPGVDWVLNGVERDL